MLLVRMHRHSDCVEYLATNGADPLVCDDRRHNTCLHFAALYGHSDCVNKLLGSRTAARGHQVLGEGGHAWTKAGGRRPGGVGPGARRGRPWHPVLYLFAS